MKFNLLGIGFPGCGVRLPGGTCLLAILLLGPVCSVPAFAQYMYMDANANGIHDEGDRLNANGDSTVVDIWLSTNTNQDGSPAQCNVSPGTAMAVNSYAFNLMAVGGTVVYRNYINRQAGSFPNPAQVLNPGDGSSYKNGYYSFSYSPAGLYRLGTLTITGTGGAPQVGFVNLVNGSQDCTSFGTQCAGKDGDNTYKLGLDWQSTGGCGSTSGGNTAPSFSAPGEAAGVAGTAFTLSVEISDPDEQDAVIPSVAGLPAGLVLEYGKAGARRTIATVRGVIEIKSANLGEHLITWSATDRVHPPIAASTRLRVSSPPYKGQELETRFREFLAAGFPHAIPRRAAQSLGPWAVPMLAQTLRDETARPQWDKAAETLGIIGTPETFDTLRSFIWDRFQGKVDDYTRSALIAAQTAIWAVAPVRADVVPYLVRCADPEYWGTLPWLGVGDTKGGLALTLSQISINGLSCIVTPDALQALQSLRERPFHPSQSGNIEEGITRQANILRLGYEANQRLEQLRVVGEDNH